MLNKSQLFIGGGWVDPAGHDVLEVFSPHDQALVGRVPLGTPADVDRAVTAARAAFDGGEWSTLSPAERIALVRRLGDLYTARVPEMAALISSEMGCPVSLSGILQAGAPGMLLGAYADIGTDYVWEETRPGILGSAIVRHAPAGVVGAIVPWNAPQLVTISKVAPALVAGCTVVLKPAPETPLDAYLLAELVEEAGFPPGVLNVVAGGADVGKAIVTHAGTDLVAFTGSAPVGSQIGADCGTAIKRCVLELGGKSAAIVLDDADLDVLAAWLPNSSFLLSGQACIAQTRILASRSNYDAVVDTVKTVAEGLVVGDPFAEATQLGPLVSERQREIVEGYIALGEEEGAKIAAGGGRPAGLDQGWYVEPTVFADVDNSMGVAQEEIFGPVLVVIPYDDEADAIRIANDSEYGLAGSVWTGDNARGLDVARRVRAGTLSVNHYNAEFCAPFGGFKRSGVGREFGVEGLTEYIEHQSISQLG